MEPRGCPHFLPASFQQGVADEDLNRRPDGDKQGDDQLRGAYAQLVGVPAGAVQEPVRAVVGPQPGQAGSGQHPADAAPAGPGEETAGQGGERAERRRGEHARERGQQRHQRRGHGNGRCGVFRGHRREPVSSPVSQAPLMLPLPARYLPSLLVFAGHPACRGAGPVVPLTVPAAPPS